MVRACSPAFSMIIGSATRNMESKLTNNLMEYDSGSSFAPCRQGIMAPLTPCLPSFGAQIRPTCFVACLFSPQSWHVRRAERQCA